MSFLGELFGIKSEKTVFIVHLGNLGMNKGEKTRRYSERFLSAGLKFIGIDVTEAPLNRPQNWEQIQDDFVKGLKQLKNNSVDIVSSEMAVGHFHFWKNGELKQYSDKYTIEIIRQVWNKLKPNGKVMITVGDNSAKRNVEAAIKKFPFVNLVIRELSSVEKKRTAYIVLYDQNPGDYISCGLFQIIAEKPRL